MQKIALLFLYDTKLIFTEDTMELKYPSACEHAIVLRTPRSVEFAPALIADIEDRLEVVILR